MKRRETTLWRLLCFAAFASVAGACLADEKCKVLDPELDETYEGTCVNGLANGLGSATGIARYVGEFKNGMKHGKGTKVWLNGDRYSGDFFEDVKQGKGVYIWGDKSNWPGERYEGEYQNDKRNGYGIYEWRQYGDRYAGPWKDDQIAGPPTPMQLARYRTFVERVKAIQVPGTTVCRDVTFGIGNTERIKGSVEQISNENVQVKITVAGRNAINPTGGVIHAGDIIWDKVLSWFPCY
jgi:hypothetical protein